MAKQTEVLIKDKHQTYTGRIFKYKAEKYVDWEISSNICLQKVEILL